MLYGWKDNLMLTNCLAACAHLTITVSEIERDIGRKSSFFHTPCIDALVRGVPVGISPLRSVRYEKKTRMVWLDDGEKFLKISLFVLTQLMNVTDTQTHTHTHTHSQTPHANIYRIAR